MCWFLAILTQSVIIFNCLSHLPSLMIPVSFRYVTQDLIKKHLLRGLRSQLFHHMALCCSKLPFWCIVKVMLVRLIDEDRLGYLYFSKRCFLIQVSKYLLLLVVVFTSIVITVAILQYNLRCDEACNCDEFHHYHRHRHRHLHRDLFNDCELWRNAKRMMRFTINKECCFQHFLPLGLQ